MPRLYVGFTEEQAMQVMASNVIPRSWFGTGISVPLKNSIASAQEALANNGKDSEFILSLTISDSLLVSWVQDSKKLQPVHHVDGYRFFGDISLNEKEIAYKMHPVELVEY